MESYQNFVEAMTSGDSNNLSNFVTRLNMLDNISDLNPTLLLTSGIGISDEAGEFSGLVKKIMFHGKDFDEDVRTHLIKELGDVLFYCAMACNSLDTTLEEVLQVNTDKLKARYPNGFSTKNSEKRKKGDI